MTIKSNVSLDPSFSPFTIQTFAHRLLTLNHLQYRHTIINLSRATSPRYCLYKIAQSIPMTIAQKLYLRLTLQRSSIRITERKERKHARINKNDTWSYFKWKDSFHSLPVLQLTVRLNSELFINILWSNSNLLLQLYIARAWNIDMVARFEND